MDGGWQERVLAWLLRLGGALTLSAYLAMVMPTAWMAELHARIGLGEFPAVPITEYLTRTISGFYGLHGGLLLLVSLDVRRYRPVVSYLAVMNVVLGTAFLIIDVEAGMPVWWIAAEGPPLIATGLAMLYLLRGVPRR